jgi:CRP/FNR family transcriptional regulator
MFGSLTHEQLEKVALKTTHRDCAKGEIVLRDGERTDYVALIGQGSVKATKYTADGREQILYVFSEGDFFGEQNLLFQKPAFYNVEALEPAELCTLRHEDFQAIVREYPDIGIQIIRELGFRLEHLENAVQNMGVRSVEARINAVLLEFAGKYGTKEPEGVMLHLPLSREGLANYIGIARETVSRKLGVLESDGVIRSINNRTMIIKDLNLLV